MSKLSGVSRCHYNTIIMDRNVIMDYNGYNGVIIRISFIIYSKCYNGYNIHVISVIMDILRPLL